MKIQMKENASQLFAKSVNRRCGQRGVWSEAEKIFHTMLKQVEGKELEVETQYLFKDQFNTVPIPDVTELGLRVMDNLVAKVIDDARPGKARCQWCGQTSTTLDECEHCHKTEYLERF